MAEPTPSTPTIEELSAYHESLRQVDVSKAALVQKLGEMVGYAVDVEGYPIFVTYDVQSPSGPRFRSLPVYGLFDDEPRKPVALQNRLLLSATETEISVAAQPTMGPFPELDPKALGRRVGYNFRLSQILSIAPAAALLEQESDRPLAQ